MFKKFLSTSVLLFFSINSNAFEVPCFDKMHSLLNEYVTAIQNGEIINSKVIIKLVNSDPIYPGLEKFEISFTPKTKPIGHPITKTIYNTVNKKCFTQFD